MSKRRDAGAEQETAEPSAVLERLSWQWARREDGQVAQALYAGEEIEEMHDTPRGWIIG